MHPTKAVAHGMKVRSSPSFPNHLRSIDGWPHKSQQKATFPHSQAANTIALGPILAALITVGRTVWCFALLYVALW